MHVCTMSIIRCKIIGMVCIVICKIIHDANNMQKKCKKSNILFIIFHDRDVLD